MKSLSKVDIEIGNSDIPISIYSAIESETRFNQFSVCCEARVNYKKVCSECGRELEREDIFKGLEVGNKIKKVDEEKIKVETGNLRILGRITDLEENGVFKDGSVWFIGFQVEKNKRKTERNLMKFSYFRDSLKESKTSFIGLISLRGKEKIVVLKPYFNGLIGLGVYHFDRIRDIQEIKGYSSVFETDKQVVKQMVSKILEKPEIPIKDIENTRDKLIENALTDKEVAKKQEINPIELVEF